jgi:hypothetical protein
VAFAQWRKVHCFFILPLSSSTSTLIAVRRSFAAFKRLFVTKGLDYHADGFEVWDGARFVYQFPQAPPPKASA